MNIIYLNGFYKGLYHFTRWIKVAEALSLTSAKKFPRKTEKPSAEIMFLQICACIDKKNWKIFNHSYIHGDLH